jgi:DNA-binding NarL/FixJ family response regulator
MNSIRVLLAEDHALVRAGICKLLEDIEDIKVVAQAADGREALELIAEHQPDIAVLDITMKGMNGLEAAARVNREFPQVRIIMLSMHSSEEYVLQALRLGASAYLIKDADFAELETAIREVAAGKPYLSPAVSKHVVDDYMRRLSGETDPLESLTKRQREILLLIAQGHNTQQMADKLFISVKTVETHRAQLMERLRIHDVAGLVRYAIRIGLIPPP